MKVLSLCLLFFTSAFAIAQTPAPRAASSDLGFTYTLPADWQALNAQPDMPQAREQAAQNASNDEEKRGIQCAQLALTARHGMPPSVIVEVALPFDCFQQQMTEKDMPGFANGASEGLRRSFDLGEPTYGSYSLGAHPFWIERAQGTPKGQTGAPAYTIEIACTPLKKAAVCWMTMAADEDSLKTFERSPVTLDADAPAALVPATAFDKKPM